MEFQRDFKFSYQKISDDFGDKHYQPIIATWCMTLCVPHKHFMEIHNSHKTKNHVIMWEQVAVKRENTK